jgi:hypothetical protein
LIFAHVSLSSQCPLLFHRTSLHSTIWNIDHMLYDYRYVMSVRCPSFTDNCDPTHVLYTTGALLDPPLFTRESGNSALHPAGLKNWDIRTLIAYPPIPMHHSSFDL